MTRPPGTAPWARAVMAAICVSLAAVLPLFLTGALAVQIGRDLGFGPVGVGLLSGAYALTAAVASAPLGRRIGSLGVRRSLRAATAISAAALLLAAAAPALPALAAAMVLGGLANAIGQPAGNATVAQHLPEHRFGIGFAIKQSAIPVATLLSGLAVPLIALPLGWRAAYLLAAAASLSAAALAPADRSSLGRRLELPVPQALSRTAWLLAGSLLLAVVAATSIGAFGASGAVAAGLGEAQAGYLLAAGGTAGLAVRLAAGLAADRWSFETLAIVSLLVALGGFGWLLMAAGGSVTFVVGLVVANAFGWGWPGLLHLSVARYFPTATAAASGITQTGVSAGLLVGPTALGWLATNVGWTTVWNTAAACALAAAGLILLTRRRLRSPGRRRSDRGDTGGSRS